MSKVIIEVPIRSVGSMFIGPLTEEEAEEWLVKNHFRKTGSGWVLENKDQSNFRDGATWTVDSERPWNTQIHPLRQPNECRVE